MKKAFILLAVLTFFIKISLYISQAQAIDSEISLKPLQEIKQGHTVFIDLKSANKLVNPVFEFKGKKYKLFNRGENKYTGLLGIDALEKAGVYEISLHDDTGSLNQKAQVKILSGKFPVQNIIVSKQTQGLTATAHELSQIGKMKNTITDESLAGIMPFNSPTEGCINSVYGLQRNYNGKFSGNYHKGIDIKAAKGVPVKSIAGGKVIFAEFFRLHGGSVAVDHGQGLVSIYIHLSKIDAKSNQIVTAGQKIGEVGSTGFATGPHLHWGLYVNGTPIDPMTNWIKPVKICK